MTPEEMQTLLSKPNNAIVGVNRREGAPQLTVIWFYWDGTSFYFSRGHFITRNPPKDELRHV